MFDRLNHLLLTAALVLLLGAPSLLAEDEVVLAASDEAAQEALNVFDREYKARGLKGDDRLMQREYAMRVLTRTQHPEIARKLAKLARNRDEMLRTLAVIYLGDQTACPGVAGEGTLRALKRHKRDVVFVITALQSIGNLRYLGASDELCALLAHDDFAIRKAAIHAIGATRDMRLLDKLLDIVGIVYNPGDEDESEEESADDGNGEVVESGYSYDGVDVFIAYSGSGDEEAERERVGQAMIEENKRKAEEGARGHAKMSSSRTDGGGGGSGGSHGGVSGARGTGSRNRSALIPATVRALRLMTGQPLTSYGEVIRWLRANGRTIRERCKELDRLERRQQKGENVR